MPKQQPPVRGNGSQSRGQNSRPSRKTGTAPKANTSRKGVTERKGGTTRKASTPRKGGTRKRKRTPAQRRVYRRRRIVAGILAVLLLAFVVFCVYSIGRGVGAAVDLARRDDLTALNRSPVPDVKDDSEQSGVKMCTDKQIKLELQSASQQVSLAGSMEFAATIELVGNESCLIDGSTASRVLTITSGDDTVYKSDVCAVKSRMLLMAAGDKDIQTMTWNTNRTGDECRDDAELPKVDRGTYVAKLSLRDVPSVTSNEVPFVVQ